MDSDFAQGQDKHAKKSDLKVSINLGFVGSFFGWQQKGAFLWDHPSQSRNHHLVFSPQSFTHHGDRMKTGHHSAPWAHFQDQILTLHNKSPQVLNDAQDMNNASFQSCRFNLDRFVCVCFTIWTFPAHNDMVDVELIALFLPSVHVARYGQSVHSLSTFLCWFWPCLCKSSSVHIMCQVEFNHHCAQFAVY